MKKAIGTTLLWFFAVLITILSAVYQRRTGPTYPLKGKVIIDGNEIHFRLQRSETVEKDTEISIEIPDSTISGVVQYQRYPSYDEWKTFPMIREGESLITFLPHQPPAGKLILTVICSQFLQTFFLGRLLDFGYSLLLIFLLSTQAQRTYRNLL